MSAVVGEVSLTEDAIIDIRFDYILYEMFINLKKLYI